MKEGTGKVFSKGWVHMSAGCNEERRGFFTGHQCAESFR